MEVSEDRSTTGRKQLVREVHQLDDEIVVEIVDEPYAVHEMLVRYRHARSPDCEVDQILVDQLYLPTQAG